MLPCLLDFALLCNSGSVLIHGQENLLQEGPRAGEGALEEQGISTRTGGNSSTWHRAALGGIWRFEGIYFIPVRVMRGWDGIPWDLLLEKPRMVEEA